MRAGRLYFILAIGFLVILGNLFRMQVLERGYFKSLSEKNRIRVIYLEAPRGQILDRQGRMLAKSRLAFDCMMIPREMKSSLWETCQKLSPILGKTPEELAENFEKQQSRYGSYAPSALLEDIGLEKASVIEERTGTMPGIFIQTRAQREYPYRDAAAHLIGFTGPMDEEEADNLEAYGYDRRDWVGQNGIEKQYEGYLHGRSGGLQIETDNRGRFVKTLGVSKPKPGKDVQLTVDAELQVFVEQRLESQTGAVVVMDLKEGEVLAVNSSPSFNPELFTSFKGRKSVGAYLKSRGSPMLNRAIQGQYPAGSIFKVVTALAALEDGAFHPTTSVDCAGFLLLGNHRFGCWKEDGHGTQTLVRALANSCNVYFYTAGVRAGVDAISKKATELGLAKPTGIDLPGEKGGFVPSREWKKKERRESWFEGETVNLSIGQGYLEITPVQALVMMSAVATGGRILKPFVVHKIGERTWTHRLGKSVGIHAVYTAAVKEGLDQVVNSDTGTGQRARVEGLRVAGKTGTAQSGQDKTHAWFSGFAPLGSPKIGVVVFLERGGHGGVSAASIAGDIFRYLKEKQYL